MGIRALVVDDSSLFRRIITEVLKSIPGVEVVGSASTGLSALQRVRELKPDLVTLDIEMPEMDGLAVLDALQAAGEDAGVIVVSSLTLRGGQMTLKALEKGAFDFIAKPDLGSAGENQAAIERALAPRVRALAQRREIRKILKGASRPGSSIPAPPAGQKSRLKRVSVILLGVSTGGPNALAQLLPAIPGDIGVPLLIVQHMPPVFTQSLAESLSAKCALRVREASHQECLEPNTAYIAPGGRQMGLRSGADGRARIEITEDPPENNCRPAVDYLFRSVAKIFPGGALAVVMTGMGSDGTLGLKTLKQKGCHVIAQDEATCVVFGMPKAAIEAGVVDAVLPLEGIAPEIVRRVR